MAKRIGALLPLVLSAVSFALVIVLVLSGTNPGSVPDGYLLSFNTTNFGNNLVSFSPITPATTTAAAPAARGLKNSRLSEPLEVKSLRAATANLISSRSIIADPQTNTTIPTSPNANSSSAASENSNGILSGTPNVNISSTATSNTNTTTSSAATTSNSTAPVLSVPQTTGPTIPAAIPVALIGTFFQLALNTFATGMGDTLQAIVKLLVTTTKASAGVNEFYTFHVSGVCFGTVFDTNSTNITTPFNLTRCVSYNEVGAYLVNQTANVSSSTFIGAANITVPALSKVPEFGRQGQTIVDLAAGIVLAIFIIGLIGNGFSLIFSVLALFSPSYAGKVHGAAAAVTTLSTQLLQLAAINSTIIALSIKTSINSFSDVLGVTSSVGGKFLGLIWVAYLAAQGANIYWMNTWFVEFRKTSFKKRVRTSTQIGDYKGIFKEVMSDLRLKKGADGEYDDTEVLVVRETVDIKHWNDEYKQM